MKRTIFEKIWEQHRIEALPGGVDLVLIDRILLHERTGGIALRRLLDRGQPVFAPDQAFAVMDHIVDTFPGRSDKTLMPTGTEFIRMTRDAAREAGIRLFDLDDPAQGIVHVMSPELGIVLPGATLICPDSHTCSQGALGALAWGIGTSEAEHALATSALRLRRPKTMRVTVDGTLAPGVTAKDLALALLGRFGVGGGSGYVVEYAGEAVRALEMEGRLTLCNMGTEFAAFTAIIAPDGKTLEYVKGRRFAPTGAEWEKAAEQWLALASDEGAEYDVELSFDAGDVAPMITWGTSPQQVVPIDAAVPAVGEAPGQGTESAQARAREYMGLDSGTPLAGLPIDAAFIGSCTNSRISDLRRAASLLQGRKVAPGIKAICVPGSTSVKRQAEAEGLHEVFQAAGFEWRESGCSMCFFAGGESFGPQDRVVSSTNRNFESRQGPGTRTHLASPETVAASAIAGRIADPRRIAS
ncbi:3-isopropylmalate dehydratase [Croceicoccus estronivorus]|uniref:3-isopropylmalate dehydratase large subunit n=1 Tax=Croceicoccus estronivorus TaxID=1172626 RepID=UPI000830DAFF|nr:3-isopropylmalate dehydratase large subunit [Croceicoccus estronivorus]OCC23567.1 3-isopropylmalate dehydratase [Croceicoccus estronivorus]